MSLKFKSCTVYISYPFAAFITLAVIADKSGTAFLSLAAAILHEAGHLLCMKLYSCLPSSIKITLFDFSISDSMLISRSSRKDLFIYASGCAVNFFAGFIFLLLSKLFCTEALFAVNASAVNFIIGLFNLLPVCGLDGGNILFIILNKKLSENKCITIIKIVSFVILMVIFTFGIIALFNNKYNYSYIIAACYLFCVVFFKK